MTWRSAVWCGVATASSQIRQCWGVPIPSWWTPRLASNYFQRTTSSFGESGEKEERTWRKWRAGSGSDLSNLLKSRRCWWKRNEIRWQHFREPPSWSPTIRSAGFVLHRQSHVAMRNTSSASSEGSQTALHHDWGQGVRQWQSTIVKTWSTAVLEPVNSKWVSLPIIIMYDNTCESQLVTWPTGWPTDRPTDWLTDRPTERSADWPTDWMTDRLTDWLTD